MLKVQSCDLLCVTDEVETLEPLPLTEVQDNVDLLHQELLYSSLLTFRLLLILDQLPHSLLIWKVPLPYTLVLRRLVETPRDLTERENFPWLHVLEDDDVKVFRDSGEVAARLGLISLFNQSRLRLLRDLFLLFRYFKFSNLHIIFYRYDLS